MADVAGSPATPFFLHVPRSDGTRVMAIMGKCMGLVQVTKLSKKNHKENDPAVTLQSDGVSTTQSIPLTDTKIGFVLDVDTYSTKGLRSVAKLDLLHDGRWNVLDSPLLDESARFLFESNNQGQVFFFMRHPVERIISYFYSHVLPATVGKHASTADQITLEDYAKLPNEQPEFNYLTKVLSNRPLMTPSSEITMHDLAQAKQVLKQKVLILLLEDKKASLERLQAYFGWSVSDTNNKNKLKCADEIQAWYETSEYDVPQINADDERWAAIFKKNVHDMDLYEYAKNILFKEQGQMLE
jgi:hypothetical protein